MMVASMNRITSCSVTPPYTFGQSTKSLSKTLAKATMTVGIPRIRERRNVHLHLEREERGRNEGSAAFHFYLLISDEWLTPVPSFDASCALKPSLYKNDN